jgi:hypothetical protein
MRKPCVFFKFKHLSERIKYFDTYEQTELYIKDFIENNTKFIRLNELNTNRI